MANLKNEDQLSRIEYYGGNCTKAQEAIEAAAKTGNWSAAMYWTLTLEIHRNFLRHHVALACGEQSPYDPNLFDLLFERREAYSR